MRQVLSVVGPVVGNFVAWALITMLPVHSVFIFALVFMSGVLMLYAMVHLRERVGKDLSTRSQS